MSGNPAVAPPPTVLAAYGWRTSQVKSVPVQQGFSGASVWQIHAEERGYALKCWPAGHPVHLPLPAIHELMQQATATGLHYIPQIKKTLRGESCHREYSQLWDINSWQPGFAQPDPSDAQLIAAVRALAQLHSVWRTPAHLRFDVCPAVQLQHQRLSSWTAEECDQLQQQAKHQPHFQLAVQLFLQHREPAIKRLQPWLNQKVSLHPCLADVWSDHVLFTGDVVTGIIDFGGMRYDHPAQDLARLVGSFTHGNAMRRLSAVAEYFPRTDTLEPLAILLDDCGTVVGLGNWLRWLVLEHRPFHSQERALTRLVWLANRLCQGSVLS